MYLKLYIFEYPFQSIEYAGFSRETPGQCSIVYAPAGKRNRRFYKLFALSSALPENSSSMRTLRAYSLGDMCVSWRKRREK